MDIQALPVVGGSCAFALSGDLDVESIPELERLLFKGNVAIPVILDASEVTFMDSTGLWILLRLAHRGEGATPGVIVRNPSQAVRRVIQIALPDGAEGLEIEFRGSGP